jgi:putative phosphoribosyl transferase
LLTKGRKFAIIGSLIVGGAIAAYISLSFAVSKLQLKFKDRAAAATILASALKDTLGNIVLQTPSYNKEQKKEDIIVLGIPRGGVIIADIVARKLSADFDIIIGRKLCSPDSKENAIGAIAEEDGTITYLNQSLINSLQISSAYIQKEKSDQLKEIKRKTAMYRDRATRKRRLKLKGRTVILVDDGIATGATIIAAIRWIKKQKPKHLIVAVPVAPKQTVNLLEKEAIDAIQIITTPSNFMSVGQFYQNFDPITDEQVIAIMRNNS